jgi:hypothetical protein
MVSRAKPALLLKWNDAERESACIAWRRGFTCGRIHGIIREQSPGTLRDFLKQRRRWFMGIRDIKGMYGLPHLAVNLWTVGVFTLAVTVINLPFTLIDKSLTPFWLAICANFCFITFYTIYSWGLLFQELDYGQPWWMIPLHLIPAILIQPFASIAEGLAAIWWVCMKMALLAIADHWVALLYYRAMSSEDCMKDFANRVRGYADTISIYSRCIRGDSKTLVSVCVHSLWISYAQNSGCWSVFTFRYRRLARTPRWTNGEIPVPFSALPHIHLLVQTLCCTACGKDWTCAHSVPQILQPPYWSSMRPTAYNLH